MDLQEVEWEGMDCIDLAQDWGRWLALVKAGMNLRVVCKCVVVIIHCTALTDWSS